MRGGVTVLALNTDTRDEQTLTIPVPGERFTLTASELTSTKVLLNGTEAQAGSDGSLPGIHGEHVQAGAVRLAPASITFLTLSSAGNDSCR